MHVAKIRDEQLEFLQHITLYTNIFAKKLCLISYSVLFFSKGALGGLIAGITLSFWVAIGSFIYPAPASKTLPLPLSIEQCVQSNITATVGPELSSRYVGFKNCTKSQSRSADKKRDLCQR